MMESAFDFLKTAVRSAGNIMLQRDSDISLEQKTSFKDFVTEYDKKVQDYLIKQITSEIPNAEFIAEEAADQTDLLADELFIIDPIDGTANFVHGINYCAISVAWYRSGRPNFGIVYNPFTDEMFYAACGGKAYLNGEEISVFSGDVRESVIAFGTSPYNPEQKDRTFRLLSDIFTLCQDVRRFGSAALDICSVACGRLGMYFEARLSLWDYAAAAIIVKEAGGVIQNEFGDEIALSKEKSSVICGSPRIIQNSDIIGRISRL